MGNRPPLPSPPSPNSHRVVLGISTCNRICGCRLHILSQSTVEAEPPFPPMDSSNNDTYMILPSPLRNHTSLTHEEFERKLQSFQCLLNDFKGGWARTMILIWASLVVIGVIVAYMIPGSWYSPIITEPWFLLGWVTTQIIVLTALFVWANRETARLIQTTKTLFRPWLRHFHIHVTFYQVANIIIYRLPSTTTTPTTIANNHHRKQSHAGSYCFVLVFTVVAQDDIDALELASVGTVDEEDEDEYDNDDGDQANNPKDGLRNP
jgi:hypothetical protein